MQRNKNSNSIAGVQAALEKLQSAFSKKYPNEKCNFNISINPFGGKYFLIVSPGNKKLNAVFPPTVDGYKIGISETLSNPFWALEQERKRQEDGND